MILLMFIYRIVSAIVTITIVAPLWICYCIITFLFSLFNNLIYTNIIQIEVPKEVLSSIIGNYNLTVLKFFTAIISPFIHLWQNLKNLKSIKF